MSLCLNHFLMLYSQCKGYIPEVVSIMNGLFERFVLGHNLKSGTVVCYSSLCSDSLQSRKSIDSSVCLVATANSTMSLRNIRMFHALSPSGTLWPMRSGSSLIRAQFSWPYGSFGREAMSNRLRLVSLVIKSIC